MFRPELAHRLARNQICNADGTYWRAIAVDLCFPRTWDDAMVACLSRRNKSSHCMPVTVYTTGGSQRYDIQDVVAEYRQFPRATLDMLDTAILLTIQSPITYYTHLPQPHIAADPPMPVCVYILLRCKPMRPTKLTPDLLLFYEWVECVKRRNVESRPTICVVESKPVQLVVNDEVRTCVYGGVLLAAQADPVLYVRAVHHNFPSFYRYVDSAFRLAVAVVPYQWSVPYTAALAVVALHGRLPSVLDVPTHARLHELADGDPMLGLALCEEFGWHDDDAHALADLTLLHIAARVDATRYTHLGATLMRQMRVSLGFDECTDAQFLIEMFESKCAKQRATGEGDVPVPMACLVLFLLEKEVYDLSCVLQVNRT